MSVETGPAEDQAGVELATTDPAPAPIEQPSMGASRHTPTTDLEPVGASWLPATTPSPRRSGRHDYYRVTTDADDRKNSIIGYSTLIAPILIMLLGRFLVTR